MKFSFQTLLFIGRSYGKISAGGAIFISPTVFKTGGYKEMSSILADQKRPRI